MAIINKTKFMNYLKVQESGTRNMFGYDMAIQEHYEEAYEHFVTNKKEEPLEVK